MRSKRSWLIAAIVVFAIAALALGVDLWAIARQMS